MLAEVGVVPLHAAALGFARLQAVLLVLASRPSAGALQSAKPWTLDLDRHTVLRACAGLCTLDWLIRCLRAAHATFVVLDALLHCLLGSCICYS